MMELNSKIFVTGHKGLVGSAILRKLKQEGYNNIISTNQRPTMDTDTFIKMWVGFFF